LGDSVTVKTGLLGGTFNPVHFGHINLAIELMEKNKLDEIWFIPTLISPLRSHEELVSSDHRKRMLELAVQGIPGFDISTIELDRSPPSYTIDTVKNVMADYPCRNFFMLFGEDTLIRFQEWKDPLEIVRRIPLLIGSRLHSHLLKRLPAMGLTEEIASAIEKGIMVTKQLEISATEIRDRLKRKLYCGHFLPGKVLDYIYENQLYSSA
jgi:nicotinate-nucleotide adenylyltransferase